MPRRLYIAPLVLLATLALAVTAASAEVWVFGQERASPRPALEHSTVIKGNSTPEALALYQQWADESKMPTPDGTVRVSDHLCPRLEAAYCAHPNKREINMPDTAYQFVAEDWDEFTDDERDAARFAFYHELGHVLDMGQNRGWRNYRLRFWEMTRGEDEELADAYAYCSMDRRRLPANAGRIGFYGYKPRPAKYRRVCAMLYQLM